MRQAIVTKFIGPTNYRGARVKARAQAGSVVVPWDHGRDVDYNHKLAALVLAERYGWPAKWADWTGGGLPDGTGNCYTLNGSDT